MKFNENLRNLRKEKDYSQEYLAEKLGVSRQTISKWENATAMPDLKKLTEIAELFETGVNELLGLESNSNNTEDKTVEIVYSNQKLEAEISKIKAKSDSNRTFVIILIILVSILAIALAVNMHSFKSTLEDFSSRIDAYRSEILFNQNTNNSDYYNNDELEYNIIGFSKDKKNHIIVELTYMPEKITKNATVSIQYNNNGKKEEAACDMKNNTYITTIELPVTSNDESIFTVFIDNGSEITKQEYYLEISNTLFNVIEPPSFSFDSNRKQCLQSSYNNFKVLATSIVNIKSAKLIMEDYNGNIVSSTDLKEITKKQDIGYEDDSSFTYVDLYDNTNYNLYCYSIINDAFKNIKEMPAEIYYEFTDENDNVFIYYELSETDNLCGYVQINTDK